MDPSFSQEETFYLCVPGTPETEVATEDQQIFEGAEFTCYEEFENAVKKHSEENFIQWVKADCKKVSTYNHHIANEVLTYQDKFVYKYVKFKCKHGGKFRRTAPTGTRPNQRSFKIDCPAEIYGSVDRKKDRIIVKIFNNIHNHDISPELFQYYPEQRKLGEDQVRELLKQNVKVKDLKAHLDATKRKAITSKDIHNVRAKMKRKEMAGVSLPGVSTRGDIHTGSMADDSIADEDWDDIKTEGDIVLDHEYVVHEVTHIAKGLVLGCYEDSVEKGTLAWTPVAEKFSGKADSLANLIILSGLGKKKCGNSRVFYGADVDYPSIAVTKIGKVGVGYNDLEEIEEGRENIRCAVAAGVKQLVDSGVRAIEVDPCGDAEAAAEAATLCVAIYDELKSSDNKKPRPILSAFTGLVDDVDSVSASWQRGVMLAEGQNLARHLMETPANHMTPTHFTDIAKRKLSSLNNVKVTVRDKEWAVAQGMGAFLSVARGSVVPLKFLELEYKGGKEGDAPFALVGKGITFDSGGISLKPSASMDQMRADMGGGACVLSSFYTAARLRIPINLMAFIPLCENMPGGHATKPGDVVTSMSGKTIQIDNTDAEGRLILCDALCYAQTFKPSGIIDMATLTGAMGVALGSAVTGVFTNSSKLYDTMHKAGTLTGDRVWRMPLMKHYSQQVKENAQTADLNNISGGRAGGACTAAAFLKEFVTHDNWMHMDIAGVMTNKSEVSYIPKGCAGRPTRTIVEFLNILSKS